MLLKGSKVEVCSNEEGFKGAWYVAKILESPPPPLSTKNRKQNPKGKVLVEYESFVCEDDEKKPLTENVDVTMIRPLPPTSKLQTFQVGDVVDGFVKDGWWKGVVIKVRDVEDEVNKKKSKIYTVKFDDPSEQIEFGDSSLRVHFDWVNGSWMRRPKLKRMEGLKFSRGMAVEVKLEEECSSNGDPWYQCSSNDDDPWFPATILQEVGFNSFLVQYDGISSKNKKVEVDCFHIRPPPPNLNVEKFEPLHEVNVLYCSAWRCGGVVLTRLGEGRYSVFLKHERHGRQEKQFNLSEIRPHMDFINGNWVTHSKETASGQEPSGHANNSAAEKTSVQQSPSPDGWTLLSHPSKKCRNETSADHLSPKQCHVKSAAKQEPGEELDAGIGTLTRCSTHQLVSNELCGETEHQSRGTFNTTYSREQPGQANYKAQNPDAAMLFECSSAAKSNSEDKTPCTNSVRSPMWQLRTYSTIYSTKPRKTAHKNTATKFESPLSQPLKKFRTEKSANTLSSSEGRVKSTQIGIPEQEAKDGNSTLTKDIDQLGNEALNENAAVMQECNQDESADQDGVMISVEDLGIPTDSKVESQLLLTAGVEQSVAEDGVSDMETEDGAGNVVGMPFEKNSPVWKMVECLEIFQRIPQNPHFHPLLSDRELDREGLAIGKMVKFANLVAWTSKVKVDSPLELFDSCWEAISDLKSYGFEVKAVVDRLNELLSIRDTRTQLECRSKQVKLQIADCTVARKEVEEAIGARGEEICERQSMVQDIILKIRQLEEIVKEEEKNLHEAEEDQARDMLVKESKESEIANLQKESSAISESISNADRNFNHVATAPLVCTVLHTP